MNEICPLCGKTVCNIIAKQMRDAEKSVFYCEECDLAFKQGYKEGIVDSSDPKGNTKRFGLSMISVDETFNIGLRNQSVNLDIVNQYVELKSDFKVLEIGCSSGYFLYHIANKVAEVNGIDFDERSIQYANEHIKNGNFSCGFLQNSCFPKNTFDVIFCFQVLEHQSNPKEFVHELFQYLKPNGQICISVPNFNDALYSLYNISAFEIFPFIDEHLLYFTEKSLRYLFDEEGGSGIVIQRQLFSLNNAFSWIFTNKPMSNFEQATAFEMPFKATADLDVKYKLNSFLKKMNEEYRKLLEEAGLATSLFYVGKKGEI